MNTPPRTLAVCGVLALALVVAFGAWFSAGSIQRQAEENARAALGSAHITGVAVSADGADVVLTADADADVARAQEVVSGVSGVGRIHTEQRAAPEGFAGVEGPASGTIAPQTSSPSITPSLPPSASPTATAPAATSRAAPAPGAADSIQFAAGSADLTSEARAQIASIAEHLQATPDVTLALVGSAGDEADRDRALELSTERARNVAEAVVAAGVDASRVGYSGSAALLTAGEPSGEGRVDVAYEER